MGQKPNEKFFTMAPYFKVTPQIGLLKSGQNETLGFTLKNFSVFFCPTLLPLFYMYLGSHKKLWAKNQMKIFQKNIVYRLSPVIPSHNHAGVYEGKVTHILLTQN